MDRWVSICRVDDIPVRGARVIERGNGVPIAVFRTSDDHVFALLDRCPHRGGPLSQGLVTGTRVVCPLHSWTVDLCSGQAASPDEGCTQAFDVSVDEGCVRLRRVDLTAPAAAARVDVSPANVDDAETPFPRA